MIPCTIVICDDGPENERAFDLVLDLAVELTGVIIWRLFSNPGSLQINLDQMG